MASRSIQNVVFVVFNETSETCRRRQRSRSIEAFGNMVEMRVSALWASLIGLRAQCDWTQTERLGRLNTTENGALVVSA